MGSEVERVLSLFYKERAWFKGKKSMGEREREGGKRESEREKERKKEIDSEFTCFILYTIRDLSRFILSGEGANRT